MRPAGRLAGALLFAAIAALAAGCGPRPGVAPPSGWVRLDLTSAIPVVELDAYESGRPFTGGIDFMGSEEVRDLVNVPASQLRAFSHRRAASVEALEQAVGVRLAWPVELGEDPYVSFVPIGWRERLCRCVYRFGLRDARGSIHELYRTDAAQVTPIAPAAVEIDLTDFAGSAVELLFEVAWRPTPIWATPPLPPPTVVWGSPALYHRRPIDDWLPGGVEHPNVILLGIDTLRADQLGPWRAQPAFTPSLSPAIDRLAAESDVWLGAYSTFNVTNPSFVSIMTGLYGKSHGVYKLNTPLPAEHETLAEQFSGAGYETLAVISAHHLRDPNSGLGQGFDRFDLAEHQFAAELPINVAMDWIAERPRRREQRGAGAARAPFFIWLHLFDPHTPHTPPDPFAVGFRPAFPSGLLPVTSWAPFRRPGSRPFTERILGAEKDLYSGEVAYVDRQVDRLVGYLESRRLLDDTLIVLVADHGENLGEHGIDFRHTGLWETTTHVPLLVRWPGGGAGRQLTGLVQTLDLFPTLLAAAGLEVPLQEGVDLRQLTYDGRTGRRAVFAEHSDGVGAMVRTATHRYTRLEEGVVAAGSVFLYDLRSDPAEETNLAGQGLPVEAQLSGLLDRWLADRRAAPAPSESALSDEEQDKLRALGYVQ